MWAQMDSAGPSNNGKSTTFCKPKRGICSRCRSRKMEITLTPGERECMDHYVPTFLCWVLSMRGKKKRSKRGFADPLMTRGYFVFWLTYIWCHVYHHQVRHTSCEKVCHNIAISLFTALQTSQLQPLPTGFLIIFEFYILHHLRHIVLLFGWKCALPTTHLVSLDDFVIIHGVFYCGQSWGISWRGLAANAGEFKIGLDMELGAPFIGGVRVCLSPHCLIFNSASFFRNLIFF